MNREICFECGVEFDSGSETHDCQPIEYCNRFLIETPIDIVESFNAAIEDIYYTNRFGLSRCMLELSTAGLTIACYGPMKLDTDEFELILSRLKNRGIKAKYLAP